MARGSGGVGRMAGALEFGVVVDVVVTVNVVVEAGAGEVTPDGVVDEPECLSPIPAA